MGNDTVHMNPNDIYSHIVNWERKKGESFLDQGFNLQPLTFMTWCLGKGYLSSKKYNMWAVAYSKNELEAIDANYFVYNAEDYNGEVPFAVVSSEEWNEKDQQRGCRILAEFISQIDIYQRRIIEYIS